MSGIQRFLQAILPKRLAARMEAESRQWRAACAECGHERSIWELGGVRWGAKGEPRRLLPCPRCAKPTWHKVSHRPGA